MKLWKSSILFVSVAVMLLSSMVVSADETKSDPTGDVWHWAYAGGMYSWDANVGNRPNIDVTEISYAVSGTQVTLTLKVAGTIANSELIHYYVYLNTSDSTYMLSWGNGEGFGFGMSSEEGSQQMDFEPEITASGNTISATFDVVGTFSTGVEVYGFAQEFTTVGDMTTEFWQDWVPNEDDPFGGQDSGDSGDSDDSGDSNPPPPTGTPGFETIAVIGAIAVALIILRKRK